MSEYEVLYDYNSYVDVNARNVIQAVKKAMKERKVKLNMIRGVKLISLK